jgi:hypothetical protein
VAPHDETPQEIVFRLELALETPAVPQLPVGPQLSPVPPAPIFAEEIATLWETAAPKSDPMEAASATTSAPRRYSAWWAFVLGPAVGAAIGYFLVPTLDHYRGDQTIREEIQRQDRAPHRRPLLPAMASQEDQPLRLTSLPPREL